MSCVMVSGIGRFLGAMLVLLLVAFPRNQSG
jgi:hypothetical protein